MLARTNRKQRFLDYANANINTLEINLIQEIKETLCLELLANVDDIGTDVTPEQMQQFKNLLTLLLHEFFLRQQIWLPKYLKFVSTILQEEIHAFTTEHVRILQQFNHVQRTAENLDSIISQIISLHELFSTNLQQTFGLVKSKFFPEDLLLPEENFYNIINNLQQNVVATLKDNKQSKEELEALIAGMVNPERIFVNLGKSLLVTFNLPKAPPVPRYITRSDLLNLNAESPESAIRGNLTDKIIPLLEEYVIDCTIIFSLLEDTEANIPVYIPGFTVALFKKCYNSVCHTIAQPTSRYLFLDILAQQRYARPYLKSSINQLLAAHKLDEIEEDTREQILSPTDVCESLQERIFKANHAVTLQASARGLNAIRTVDVNVKDVIAKINFENMFIGLSDNVDLSSHVKDRKIAIRTFNCELKKAETVKQIEALVVIAKPFINRHKNPKTDSLISKDTATWNKKLQQARAKGLELLGSELADKPAAENIAWLKCWEKKPLFSQHRHHFWFSDLPWRTRSQTKIKELYTQFEDKPLINLTL
jgi:hypothetical protein